MKEIVLGNTLLNYEIDPLANENNTLYRDPKSVNMVQTRIGKTVSEMMKALGFVPAPSNRFINTANVQKNNLTINPDVFAAKGKYIMDQLEEKEDLTFIKLANTLN